MRKPLRHVAAILVGALLALPFATAATAVTNVWGSFECHAETTQDGVSIEITARSGGSRTVVVLIDGGSAGYVPGEMMPMLTEFPDGDRRLSTLEVAYADEDRTLLRGDFVSDWILDRLARHSRFLISVPGAMLVPLSLSGSAEAVASLRRCGG